MIRSAYGPKTRQRITFPEKGRTKQAMQSECDINNIMAKYQKTGVIDFVNEHQSHYGDVTGIGFQNSMQTVTRARELFGELPSSVRKRFGNDPMEFFEFVNDPENREEAIKLRLVKPEHQRKGDTAPQQRARRTGDSEAPKPPSETKKPEEKPPVKVAPPSA